MDIKKQIAEQLNGILYRSDIPNNVLELAKNEGIVILMGHSDDCASFSGAMEDVAYVDYGGDIEISSDGLIFTQDDDIDQSIEILKEAGYKVEKPDTKNIKAIWCPKDMEDCSWAYDTDLPHVPFRVIEDGELYCLGIVFSLEDI